MAAHHNSQERHRQAFLAELGRRLRSARERAELTVSELARRTGVSRRHVTEAEAGRANLSVIKLAELALELCVPLRTLCDLELRAHRGANARHSERIALVGLRGAGKSTLGRRLALALEVPFVELDARVEELAGMSLGEIFDLHGEEYFRRLEGEALEEALARGERSVIAAGGSIVTSSKNFARLREACRTVWLKAEPELHFQRVIDQGDRRPMANRPRAMAELEGLLEAREPLYAQCDVTVDTSRASVDELVHRLLRELAA
jgi:XRE family aerobic/anaerobic benzoate catabolism transcriptional regulator